MDKKHARELVTTADDELVPEESRDNNAASLKNILEIIESKITKAELKAVQEIGLAIGKVGMNLTDACFRARLTRDEMDEIIEKCPEVQTYFHLKQVEYKYELLKVVTHHATETKDVKIAMWLLEKQYGEEYDSSLKKDIAKMNRLNPGDDVVEMAFAFIRRQNADAMPVNKSVGDAEDRSEVKIYDIKETLV